MITRRMQSRWPGVCCVCGRSFPTDTDIFHSKPDRAAGERGHSRMWHHSCDPAKDKSPQPLPPEPTPDAPTPEPPFKPIEVKDIEPKPEKRGDSLGDTIADEVWRRIEPRIKRAIPEPPPDGKPLRRRISIIERPNRDTIEIEDTHPLFERLLTYINRGQYVYLHGAAGAGKSHTAQQVAKALDRPFYYLGLTPATMPTALFGHTLATSRDEVVRPMFREAWENGGVFLYDEPDNGREDMNMCLNGALAARVAAFPDAMVDMHPDFVLIAAGNTAGLGGDTKYPTRRRLDEAFRSRFLFLEWTYDATLERSVARKFAGTEIPTEAVDAWVAWVREVRDFCDKRFPTLVITPRASYNGAALLDTETVANLADLTVFCGIKPDQQREILAACALPSITLKKA